MSFINIEIKAKCIHPEKVDAFLVAHDARFIGEDHQIDTYFNVPNGRLKLREGNIEHNLIWYARENSAAPKSSEFILTAVNDPSLKETLIRSLGVKVIVDKRRRIYFIDNVKFHVDEVKDLGSFMEIEAGNRTDLTRTKEDLQVQCEHYMNALNIQQEDLIHCSYSDLLLQQH